jgi:hypothetical protein
VESVPVTAIEIEYENGCYPQRVDKIRDSCAKDEINNPMLPLNTTVLEKERNSD